VTDLRRLVKAYDIRGLVPDELDAEVACALGAAVADVLVLAPAGTDGASATGPDGRPLLAVGHDMRPSSPLLAAAFADGVSQRGVDVVLIGLCSTDGLYHASGWLGVAGAMFTASHNPAQYNGIKLCRPGALPVGQDSGLAEIRDLAEGYLADGVPAVEDRGTRTERATLADYGAHLRSLVDLSAIRRLRVVVDAGNGMAGLTVPAVLGTAQGLPELPLDVVPLYFTLDGTFPNHEANPLDPANIVDLQRAVREHGADLGLAFDGDADRCAVVDERGEVVSASAVTALVALRRVAEERAAGRDPLVIHNLITSRAVPELVTAAGGSVLRSRVGHSFVKGEMARTGAVFGGEHSAHYYFREFWGADTGMLAAMHVLAALGAGEGPLSALVDGLDPYSASGEINSTVDDAAAVAAEVERTWVSRGAGTDHLDGLTVTSPDGEAEWWWFNLRPSNTEPLLRLNVEAVTTATMERVRDEVLAQVRTPATATGAREAPTDGGTRALAGWHREVLRCPACRGELTDTEGPGGPELVCRNPQCGLAYRVDDGVPVLLVDEARRP
jgi:phosphomannomutase